MPAVSDRPLTHLKNRWGPIILRDLPPVHGVRQTVFVALPNLIKQAIAVTEGHLTSLANERRRSMVEAGQVSRDDAGSIGQSVETLDSQCILFHGILRRQRDNLERAEKGRYGVCLTCGVRLSFKRMVNSDFIINHCVAHTPKALKTTRF